MIKIQVEPLTDAAALDSNTLRLALPLLRLPDYYEH